MIKIKRKKIMLMLTVPFIYKKNTNYKFEIHAISAIVIVKVYDIF